MFSCEDVPLAIRDDVTSLDVLQHARERGHLWVAVDPRDIPVGFLMAGTVDGNFHILEMDVHPDHTGQGIGRLLLRSAFNAASVNGFPGITLTTFEHVMWNAPFYSRMGFKVLDESRCGRDLLNILNNEKARGLKNRIAMYREVT
jgi:GNAT superfamily N-acetyltransferase